MKFHHIGIATENIEKTLSNLKKYFNIINISEIIYDEKQDAKLCMITLEDNTQIELISGKIVENFLKHKQYLYHVCFTVGNIGETIEKFVSSGSILLSEPKRASLFNGRLVAFLTSDIGFVELLEEVE